MHRSACHAQLQKIQLSGQAKIVDEYLIIKHEQCLTCRDLLYFFKFSFFETRLHVGFIHSDQVKSNEHFQKMITQSLAQQVLCAEGGSQGNRSWEWTFQQGAACARLYSSM